MNNKMLDMGTVKVLNIWKEPKVQNINGITDSKKDQPLSRTNCLLNLHQLSRMSEEEVPAADSSEAGKPQEASVYFSTWGLRILSVANSIQ